MSGRVIVVGSVNVDLVIRGARLPGPGETVTGGTFERHHGGKGGNQAVAAARLGPASVLVGAIGDDDLGREARAAIQTAGVNLDWLRTIQGEVTGVALILVDANGENLIAVAAGANARLTPEAVTEALRRLEPRPGDVLLVSREIPFESTHEALRAGRAAGARTILNPAPADGIERVDLALVDILTPNRGELATIAAHSGMGAWGEATPDEPELLARHLLGSRGVREAVVITLGADGALLVPADGTASAFAARAVDAVDATGAGDAFSGALAALLAGGQVLDEAVRMAVVAAGLSTTVRGAREGLPTSAEVAEAISMAEPSS